MAAERGGRHPASLDDRSTDHHSVVVKHLLFASPCAGPFAHDISFSHALSLRGKHYSRLTDEETDTESFRGCPGPARRQRSELNLVSSDCEA